MTKTRRATRPVRSYLSRDRSMASSIAGGRAAVTGIFALDQNDLTAFPGEPLGHERAGNSSADNPGRRKETGGRASGN